MPSYGYYKICPQCWRKYGRHFVWCLDCTPRAKRYPDGSWERDTYRTRWGNFKWHDRVWLVRCHSKKLPLDKRLEICHKCRARFKCLTEAEDD